MELPKKIAALHERLVIDRARALAMAGRLRQAEELLDGLEAMNPPSGEACDVRARICAQTGKYDEARKFWLRARDVSAEPASYAAELEALATYQRWPARAWIRRWSPMWSVVVVVAAIAMVVSEFPHGRTKSDDRRTGIADAQVASRDGAHEVRFKSGLFSRGATLSEQGKEALETWARQAKGGAPAQTIFVLGHTNDLPFRVRAVYADNYELGLARAQAVVMYLRSTGGLKDGNFALGSAGDADPPFSNETSDGRRRNMTVTITISTDNNKL